MKKKLAKIFNSDFNRNVLVLSSGTAISQLILVLISPVLTRLYTPEAFGTYAVFLSIAAIIGTNINLKFDQAIMLPKDEDDAYKLAYLSNYLNLVFSFIFLLLILVFYTPVASFLNVDPSTSYWLFLIPLSVYFIGFNTVLVTLNNRLKNYKSMSGSVIAKNTAMTMVQLTLGFFKILLSSGLIIGQLIAYVFGNRVLRLNVKFSFKQMLAHHPREFKSIMKRYKDFPRFAFPAGVANAATLNINNILITSVYSISSVGFFSLANRILGAPSVLISRSISQVYFQQASEEIAKRGNCKIVFKSTLRKLIFLAIPIFVPIALLSEYLFPIIFGEDWVLSGIIAKYLTLLVAIRFVSSSLSGTLMAAEKQKISLYNNIVLLLVNILLFYFMFLFKIEFIGFIIIYSLTIGFLYLIFLFTYYKVATTKATK